MQIYVLNLLICFFELFICFLLTEETLILTALSDFLCLFYIHLNNINAVFIVVLSQKLMLYLVFSNSPDIQGDDGAV